MKRTLDEAGRAACLEAMGIEQWTLRDRLSAAPVAADPVATGAAPRDTPGVVGPIDVPPAAASSIEVDGADFDSLRNLVAGCTRCALHEGRIQTVFGVGNAAADWMIIGEAPGQEEDRRGEPFVGRAGQLLDSMLRAIGLDRETVFITNILKCRPPNNRDPRPEEVAGCGGYLQRQIDLVAPRVILAVGRIAAQNLLGVTTPIGKLRGRRYAYGSREIPLVVTYHPAYLLRAPREKRKAWADLQFALEVMAGRQ